MNKCFCEDRIGRKRARRCEMSGAYNYETWVCQKRPEENRRDTVANPRVRLRRRRRLAISRRRQLSARARGPVVVMAICLIAALAGYIGAHDNAFGGAGLSYTAQAEEEVVYKTVTVRSGDTLWGIASEYAEPSKDIRVLIREICELNGVKAGQIYPGQLILVPIPAHLA